MQILKLSNKMAYSRTLIIENSVEQTLYYLNSECQQKLDRLYTGD